MIIHTANCCLKHGCKIYDADCPVVNESAEQDGPCEQCPSLKDIQEEIEFWQEELHFWQLLDYRKVKELLAQERLRLKAQQKKT